MELVRPGPEWEREHRSYIEEWGPSRLVPSSFSLEPFGTYEEYLEDLSIMEKRAAFLWMVGGCLAW